MRRVFTAQQPPGGDAADTLLLDDRWRWVAAAAPLLWALWGRHWIVALGVVAGLAVQLDMATAGQPGVAALIGVGVRLALGLEGGAAARLDRRLRRWRDLGGVVASDAAEAELRWFGAQAGARAGAAS